MNIKIKEDMETEKLLTLFDPQLCIFNLRSKKKLSALKEMVGHLYEQGRISDEDLIMKMLKNRESLGSTGLGKGVAFPHGKSLAIKEVAVLFARSSQGVDFDALDDKPVHVFFLILAPSDRGAETYLELLSDLLGIIKQPDKLEKLLKADDFSCLAKILGGQEN